MIDIQVLGSGSAGNCYRISDGSTTLLLECGIRYKDIQKGVQFKMSEVAGCLVTHEHGDHCKSLKDVMRAGIDCYMSSGTASALNIHHHRLKRVKNKEPFQIGTWRILPFDVQHDVSEPYGFLLANKAGDKLLFATDTYYIKYRFKDLTHIMVECNYSVSVLNDNILAGRTPSVMKGRLLRSHFSLENVKEFFKANDLSSLEEIWLLHLSDSNSNEAQFKKEIMQLTGKAVYIA